MKWFILNDPSADKWNYASTGKPVGHYRIGNRMDRRLVVWVHIALIYGTRKWWGMMLLTVAMLMKHSNSSTNRVSRVEHRLSQVAHAWYIWEGCLSRVHSLTDSLLSPSTFHTQTTHFRYHFTFTAQTDHSGSVSFPILTSTLHNILNYWYSSQVHTSQQ